MVILVVFNSFNVVKNLKKPDLVARQKPPFYTTDVQEECEPPAALLQIGFSDKSIYRKLKNIHFGFSTEEELKNLQRQDKVSSTNVKTFKKEVAIMIISIVEKMSEKSLLNYCLVRTADVFDPVLMVYIFEVK